MPAIIHPASFTATPTSGAPPLAVTFTDTTVSGPTTWAWDFGDPASGGLNTSTVQNPTHTYSSVGSYSVSLTVTGPGSFSPTTMTNFITVAAGDPHGRVNLQGLVITGYVKLC